VKLTPREWPPWAWALLTLAATPLGYQLSLGRHSLGTGIALLAGSYLGARRGAYAQLLALGPALLLTGTGLAGSPVEWGYLVGQVGAAALAGWLAPADQRLQHPRLVWRTAVLMIAAAIPAALAWQEPWAGLQLRTYYNAVLVMALVIAIYYAMRLVKHPLRVLGFMVALLPFYAAGLDWILILGWWQGAPVAGAETWGNLAFHGYVAHLPADVLTGVVVAFFSGPKTGR
jgi:hypothetical protein